MISEKYKCIFIEVPKTGSTSIRNILGFPKKPHLNIIETKQELIRELHLRHLYRSLDEVRVTKSPEQLANVVFEDYFKFGFVRNPWDRTVALYERKEGQQLSEDMTFDQFVDWINYSSDTCIHPTRHKNQLDWFVDEAGDVCLDFIGTFETLAKDWQVVCNRLGLDRDLPHANKGPSDRKHYTEYYNKKTQETIRKKFMVDIEYFGYEFGT